MPAKKPRRPSSAGRPPAANPALTQEVIDRVCAGIRAGTFAEGAAALAGVRKSTYYAWLKKGANDRDRGLRNLHTRFLDATTEACAQLEAMLTRLVLLGATGRPGGKSAPAVAPDWRAAAWMLERRFGRNWALQVRVMLEREQSAFLEAVLQAGFSDEVVSKLLEIAAGQDTQHTGDPGAEGDTPT